MERWDLGGTRRRQRDKTTLWFIGTNLSDELCRVYYDDGDGDSGDGYILIY